MKMEAADNKSLLQEKSFKKGRKEKLERSRGGGN
jgi:hypothetical protein